MLILLDALNVLIKAHLYSFQLYVILATVSQNFGKLKRRGSEVHYGVNKASPLKFI